MQLPQVRARLDAEFVGFRDVNGTVGYTSPGAHSLDLNAPWGWVYSIRNC